MELRPFKPGFSVNVATLRRIQIMATSMTELYLTRPVFCGAHVAPAIAKHDRWTDRWTK